MMCIFFIFSVFKDDHIPEPNQLFLTNQLTIFSI